MFIGNQIFTKTNIYVYQNILKTYLMSMYKHHRIVKIKNYS